MATASITNPAELSEAFGKIRACIDRTIPPQLIGEALTRAVNERPDNILRPSMAPGVGMALAAVPRPVPMAVVATKLWKPGRTLRVSFLDSTSAFIRQKVEQFAHEWEQFANVRLQFGNDPDAEIRITGTLGIGSWSFLGTDALVAPPGQPTMNYGWFTDATPDDEFSRTVLHEFGHALGAIHEHQNPEGNIPWNRTAAMRFYMETQGWTKEEVEQQLFAKYDRDSLNLSSYDPESIMHYPVPAELLEDPSGAVGWNRVVSKQDKEFMGRMYP